MKLKANISTTCLFTDIHCNYAENTSQSASKGRKNCLTKCLTTKNYSLSSSLNPIPNKSVKFLLEILSELKDCKETNFSKLNSHYTSIRKNIVDWIFEFGECFNINFKTIQISIAFLDLIILNNDIEPALYYKYAAVCAILASKFYENERKIPKLSELLIFFPNFQENQLKNIEISALKALNWDLNIVIPLDFFEIYSEIGVILENECVEYEFRYLTQKFLKYSEFFFDLCMQESQFLKYNKESIAIGCIAASRKVIGLEPWPMNLQKISSVTLSQTCFKSIWAYYISNFQSEFNKSGNKENRN